MASRWSYHNQGWTSCDEWSGKSWRRKQRRSFAEAILEGLRRLEDAQMMILQRLDKVETVNEQQCEALANMGDQTWYPPTPAAVQGTTWYCEVPQFQMVEKIIEIPSIRYVEKIVDISTIDQQGKETVNRKITEPLEKDSDRPASEVSHENDEGSEDEDVSDGEDEQTQLAVRLDATASAIEEVLQRSDAESLSKDDENEEEDIEKEAIISKDQWLDLVGPRPVFKQPHGNKRLRAYELPAIGDQHEHRDKVMMMEGRVWVEEVGTDRLKVAGKGRAVIGGTVHHVWGWITRHDRKD